MFAVLCLFKTKPGQQETFEKAWEGLTQLIYQYEGSLGSRLHKKDAFNYLAYAQWPDRNTWENSGENLPESADIHRNDMRSSCESIETLYEMEMINDLLQTDQSIPSI